MGISLTGRTDHGCRDSEVGNVVCPSRLQTECDRLFRAQYTPLRAGTVQFDFDDVFVIVIRVIVRDVGSVHVSAYRRSSLF
jgi:hypothetical protein